MSEELWCEHVGMQRIAALLDRVRLRRYARRVGRDPEVQAWAAEQRKLVAEGFYRNDSLVSSEPSDE